MPAPSAAVIRNELTKALLARGFTSKTHDLFGNVVEDKNNLPDALKKMVEALASADSMWMGLWMQQQPVNIPVTSAPGSPSFAPGPLGLP